MKQLRIGLFSALSLGVLTSAAVAYGASDMGQQPSPANDATTQPAPIQQPATSPSTGTVQQPGAGASGAQTGMPSSGTMQQPGTTMEQPGASASGTQMGAQMGMQKPVTPGPQDDAIAPLFGTGGTWTGQLAAGAMGPGSAAGTSQGQAHCQRVLDGLWYRCDVQERMGEGAQAMTFRGEMIVGYDRTKQTYTAFMADNQGSQGGNMEGQLQGKKLALETPTEIASMGQRYKERLTFDFTDPGNIRFTNEHKPTGKDWQVFESAVIHTGGAGRQARTPTPMGR